MDAWKLPTQRSTPSSKLWTALPTTHGGFGINLCGYLHTTALYREHMSNSSKLIQALEKQMTLLQPSGMSFTEQVTPAEWFLHVLQTRATVR